MKNLFEGLEIDPKLVCKFFAFFSRFEYALKATGYYCGEERIKPNWKKFRKDMDRDFKVEKPDIDEAIQCLLLDTPLVQQSPTDWVKLKFPKGEGAVANAIQAACQVRNNLFHGGKHTRHSDRKRDEMLIECSLTILEACLDQHQSLNDEFLNPRLFPE